LFTGDASASSPPRELSEDEARDPRPIKYFRPLKWKALPSLSISFCLMPDMSPFGASAAAFFCPGPRFLVSSFFPADGVSLSRVSDSEACCGFELESFRKPHRRRWGLVMVIGRGIVYEDKVVGGSGRMAYGRFHGPREVYRS
jgi:hypothetical protein